MSPEHFKEKSFDKLLKKALKSYNREEVFFADTTQDTVDKICIDIDNIIKNNSFNKNDTIVICGFRMTDNRCEPIFFKLNSKYNVSTDGDIDSMSLYTLIALYLYEKRVPTVEEIKKYIVYDAVYGSGNLFYNMSYY